MHLGTNSHPPCQEETGVPGENPRLSTSVDWLFHIGNHSSAVRIEPTIPEVKGACYDDCATEVSRLHVTTTTKMLSQYLYSVTIHAKQAADSLFAHDTFFCHHVLKS